MAEIQLFVGNIEEEDGPDIEKLPMDGVGGQLRDLLLPDLDKCSCTHELFDADPQSIGLYVSDLGSIGQMSDSHRWNIPLREPPLEEVDLIGLFQEASRLAKEVLLVERDLTPAACLIPQGSKVKGPKVLPVLEVPQLPHPILVAEPLFLGQYIQNYVHFGAFLQLNGVQRYV